MTVLFKTNPLPEVFLTRAANFIFAHVRDDATYSAAGPESTAFAPVLTLNRV